MQECKVAYLTAWEPDGKSHKNWILNPDASLGRAGSFLACSNLIQFVLNVTILL